MEIIEKSFEYLSNCGFVTNPVAKLLSGTSNHAEESVIQERKSLKKMLPAGNKIKLYGNRKIGFVTNLIFISE